MREAAEDAETDQFNPAIEAASGDEADALQNGKIQNKVLKLTGEVQVLQIKLAKAKASGADTSSIESQITTEQCVSSSFVSTSVLGSVVADFCLRCRTKLNTNIATDTKSAGAASKGVA